MRASNNTPMTPARSSRDSRDEAQASEQNLKVEREQRRRRPGVRFAIAVGWRRAVHVD
jgi:hypothetical protein